MSVARCLEINARLRAAGIKVHEASGWQSRGNGQTSAYEGGIVHHTASGYGIALSGTGIGNLLINGRSDLRGPLCNYAGNDDGSITVIAAHPANHAGASGGRSMGPLPVTSLFNRRVMGLEIVYPGTSPMRDAQYRAALVWAKAVADVCGGRNIERIRAHAETSITGKWDPGDAPGRTINMVAFRRAAIIVPEEDDMQLTDRANWKAINALGPDYVGHKILSTWQHAYAARVLAAQTLAAVTSDVDITPERLDASVDKAIAKHMPTAEQVAAEQLPHIQAAVRDVLGEDNTAQADAIVDALVARLANPEGN